jgi:type III restriction enzyme
MAETSTSGRFGIAPWSAAKLLDLFDTTPNLDRVWIYGSRARGDHRDESDIDLAVDAPEMTSTDFSRLAGRLEELGLIYRVDMLHLQSNLEQSFRSNIERDRKVFWEPRRHAAEPGEMGAVELKDFQRATLTQLAKYVDELVKHAALAEKKVNTLRAAEIDVSLNEIDFPLHAWNSLRKEGKLPPVSAQQDYSSRFDGAQRPVPNVCLKLPTGGGKTLLATAAIARLQSSYYRRHTGLVLWIVPNEAIYRQTKKAISDRDHAYRQLLNVAGAGRVKILEKDSPITRTDVESHLCVMLLMLQSAARQSKETLRFFRDRGNVHGFFPREDDQQAHFDLLRITPNYDVYAPHGASAEEAARSMGSIIKDSLGNVMRLARPMVVIDEGHHAYTENALKTIDGFNPSFVLELSATPRVAKKKGEHGANILVDVRGGDLERAEMIKLPINVDVRPWPDWKACLAASVAKLEELQRESDRLRADTGRYLRPILLVQVERTGADQTESGLIHADHAEAYLLQLGFSKAQIAIKTSEKDELKQPENIDLLSPACEVRAIITRQALQEGWDCPFAYVLCALAAGRNPAAVTQLVGRILRQPNVTRTWRAMLDESYVFCHDAKTGVVVKSIKDSLEAEGMGDLMASVRTANGDDKNTKKNKYIRRRTGMEGLRIFLPRVTWNEGDSRRELAYESDVLGNLPWERLDALKIAATWRPEQKAQHEQRMRIGLEILDRAGSVSPTDEARGPGTVDRVFIARAIGDLVPNTWLAFDLVNQVVDRLIKAGIEEAKIASSSALLVEQMRADLVLQRDALAQEVFEQKVRDGKIEFQLRADRLNYEIPSELEIELPEKPVPLFNNGQPLEKSLFNPFYQAMVDNDFEGDFACYLDSQAALMWWHRNIARGHYGLQGWRRDKVYPDFVFLHKERSGKPVLVVMETKGAHLKNEDTDYKKQLLKELTEAYAQARWTRAGELALEGRGAERIVCDLVFDENWRNELNSRHFAGGAKARS